MSRHAASERWAMTLIGSYVDKEARIASVSMEATRRGSYLIVKDRWRSPLLRDGAPVVLELGSSGNARMWAECDVLARGGQLRESAESFCAARSSGGWGRRRSETAGARTDRSSGSST